MMRELLRFLLRGAFGGALLQLLLSVLLFAAYPAPEAFIVLFLMLTIPASVGAVIGGILWLCARARDGDNGLITRIVIGASFATLLSAIFFYWVQHHDPGSARDYQELLVASPLIGLEIGSGGDISPEERACHFSAVGDFHVLPIQERKPRCSVKGGGK